MRQAVILAGGKGTRLGAVAAETPKPLLPIAGDLRFLDILIENFARHGVRDIWLVAGHIGEKIAQRYREATIRGARINVIIEPEPAGTGGALLQVAKHLDDVFLLSNGDSIFDINYLALAATLGAEDVARLALRRVPDAGRYGRVTLDGERVASFQEKDDTYKESALISGGVYAVRRDILGFIDKIPTSIETNVFPELCRRRRLSGMEFDGYFIDIGLPETLSEARATLTTHLRRRAVIFHSDITDQVIAPGDLDRNDSTPLQAEIIEAIRACNDAGALALAICGSALQREDSSDHAPAVLNNLYARLAAAGAHLDHLYDASAPVSENRALPELSGKTSQNEREIAQVRRATLDWRLDADRVAHLSGEGLLPTNAPAINGMNATQAARGALVQRVRHWLQTPQDPAPADFSFRLLRDRANASKQWLFGYALPLWWTNGFDRDALCFHERLDLRGSPVDLPRRIRVQARQTFVYAMAGNLGWDGPWREAVTAGADLLVAKALRPDGGTTHLLDSSGQIIDRRRDLYDCAFVIFALAHASKALGRPDLAAKAQDLADWIGENWSSPHGGYLEGEIVTAAPRRQNPHMHMLEALLALYEAAGCARNLEHAGRLLDLFKSRFVTPTHGALLEYFAHDWSPLPGAEGATVEPGHELEWAWLVDRAYRLGAGDARAVARDLHIHAEVFGVDHQNGFIRDEVWADGAPMTETARLWPSTERLKANLVWFERTHDPVAAEACAQAFDTIMSYCDTQTRGVWRDRRLPSGAFIEEAAPASSFYHIMLAMSELIRVAEHADAARRNA